MLPHLPSLLKKIRLEASLSARELAASLAMTPTSVFMLEAGTRTPRPETLDAWAKACGRELRISLDVPGPAPTVPPPSEGAAPLEVTPDEARLLVALRKLGASAGEDQIRLLLSAAHDPSGGHPVGVAAAWAILAAGGERHKVMERLLATTVRAMVETEVPRRAKDAG